MASFSVIPTQVQCQVHPADPRSGARAGALGGNGLLPAQVQCQVHSGAPAPVAQVQSTSRSEVQHRTALAQPTGTAHASPLSHLPETR
jgi:hypothetical protein